MWISRGILQKVLQLNRFFLYLISVLLISGAFFISAEEPPDENIAFLSEGPVYFEGIPGIGDNVIPGYKGTYIFKGDRISIYYTAEEILIFSSWEKTVKGNFAIYRIDDKELCFTNNGKWSIFIVFQNTGSYQYDFASELIQKMLFFAKTEEFFKVSSFPAIITVKS